MVSNPPDGYQHVIPYLHYADAPAALEFLCKALGFQERFRMEDGDRIGHAEIALGDSVLMIASVYPDMGHCSPAELSTRYSKVFCYVPDVDAHHAQAVASGAIITAPLEDKPYGDRMYACTDLEGHHWYFGTHLKDVSPEEMSVAS